MKLSNKIFTGAALGALLSMSTAANAVNVGGVNWDPNSLFDFTSNSNLIEDQLDLPNGIDTLVGFGNITNINNTTVATFCPGCELTYVFGGFTVADVIVGADTQIAFQGGWIDFYVDKTPDYDSDDKSTAMGDLLWLRLEAHEVFSPAFGINASIVSTLTSFGAGTDAGNGNSLMDATGGVALGNFDTDTQTDGADFVFSSSFQPIPNGGVTSDGYELFGSADLRGTSIPEPASLALFGLGLLGLGLGRRRIRK